MATTFDTVDQKVAEVEFFLQKMATAGFDPFAFNCYLSAYLASARTATLALQHFKHIPGFDSWYEKHRSALRTNKLAKFFLDVRNYHLHGGDYPVSGGTIRGTDTSYWFDSKASGTKNNNAPREVVETCRGYFLLLLEIVYDCYVVLGVQVDPQQYYTKQNFARSNMTIDQAEAEIYGWVMTSYINEGWTEDARWQELRSHVGECGINHLFHSYLGKVTPQPELPDEYYDFEPSPEERGWVYIPAGYASVEEYIEKAMGQRRSGEDER